MVRQGLSERRRGVASEGPEAPRAEPVPRWVGQGGRRRRCRERQEGGTALLSVRSVGVLLVLVFLFCFVLFG